MTDLPASNALQDLIFVALDHGVDSAREGGPVIPFLVEESTNGSRNLQRFVTEDLEESVSHARTAAANSTAERIVVCFDGYVTLDEERTDAVYVVGQERGGSNALTFLQRYRPADATGGFTPMGNTAYAGADDRLF